MAGEFDGGDEQGHGQYGDEDHVRDHAEQQSAEYGSGDLPGDHDEGQVSVGAQHREAAVAAVAGEGHQHRRQ